MENYYIQKLNSLKEVTRIFGVIPIPNKTPLTFMISNLILSMMIEIIFGTYFISLVIAIFISYETYRKNKIKLEMLEYCIVEEIFMGEELERNGVGEFQNDSPFVTDEDRNYIFKDSLSILKRNKYLHKIKNHYRFLFSIVILYSISFISLNFYLS